VAFALIVDYFLIFPISEIVTIKAAKLKSKLRTTMFPVEYGLCLLVRVVGLAT